MGRTSKRHHQLLNGEGKCSVPMWCGGMPAGFCDEPAYGKQTKYEYYRDPYTGERVRYDGKYSGIVTGLACHGHGGPAEPDHTMKCNTCGEDFDMRELTEVIAHEHCGVPFIAVYKGVDREA